MSNKIVARVIQTLILIALLTTEACGQGTTIGNDNTSKIINSPDFTNQFSQVLIKGNWGKNIDEFGLDNESPKNGPGKYYLTPNDKLIIEDGLNARLKIYDLTGRFLKSINVHFTDWHITCDKHGNVYIIGTTDDDGIWKIASLKVEAYNENGELINVYPISRKLPLPGTTEPYFNVSVIDDKVYAIVGARYAVNGKPWYRYLSIGTTSKVYSTDEQELLTERAIEKIRNNSKTQTVQYDRSGYKYIQVINSMDSIVYNVYGKNNKFIKSVKTPQDIGFYEGSCSPKVDKDGNIYYMHADSTGFAIIKIENLNNKLY